MNKWHECPHCNFSRDSIRILNCCSTMACDECIAGASSRCPRCFTFLAINIRTVPCFADSLEDSINAILVKCSWAGCSHMSTRIMIEEHQRTCPHAPPMEARSEVYAAFSDSLNTRQQRTQNILKHFRQYANIQALLREADPSFIPNVDTQGYIEHIILESDTLPGLSLKYGTSAEEIKIINKLPSGNLYERKTLKIPIRKSISYTKQEKDELEEMLRKRLLLQFKQEHRIEDRAEAQFYLDETNYDYEQASLMYRSDRQWDSSQRPPQSLTNPSMKGRSRNC